MVGSAVALAGHVAQLVGLCVGCSIPSNPQARARIA